jgi:hypothetical protein
MRKIKRNILERIEDWIIDRIFPIKDITGLRTIELSEEQKNRTLEDALTNPLPFPKFRKPNKDTKDKDNGKKF